MKKKTGTQEHTIIIGTILASILVFVLGFFLGRVWVLMPQEKMVNVKKEPAPAVVEQQEKEFEDILAQLKQQKMREESERKQKEAEERDKKIKEEKSKKEIENRLALLQEKKREEERKKGIR